ncbi:Asp23/Gls24 family envelope stress response protein [Streptomyces fagopyri]|uniref:Asp23/Gls24 family envelope stress response protein n=1 Tax=Streptomyces fagopyri TaxID=2662397 RepID=UPI001885A535|nr:Asp23/Gls24 family envelope stress response protein [Streptomyces fagopyri]
MTTHTDPPDLPRPSDPDDEPLPCGRFLSQVWETWESAGATDPHLRECRYCRPAVQELEDLESAVRRLREESPGAESYDAAPLARRVMDVVRLELRPGRPLPLGEPAENLWIMEAVAARTLRTAAETVAGVRAGSCRIAPAPTVTDPRGQQNGAGHPGEQDPPRSPGSDGSLRSPRPDRSPASGAGTTGRSATAGPAGSPRSHPTGPTDLTEPADPLNPMNPMNPPGQVDVHLEIHAPLTAGLPELAEEVRCRVREAASGRLGLDTARIDIRVTDLTDAPADTEEGRAR